MEPIEIERTGDASLEEQEAVQLERDGVANVNDHKQAMRSGGAWQDRMGCGCNAQQSQGFTDIMKVGRICTDIPWLFAYATFVIGLFAIVYIPAYVNGDADYIIYGVDYYKRVCGKSSGVTDRSYAMWPNPSNYNLRMCVEDCTSTEVTANVLAEADGGMGIYASTSMLDMWCIPSSDISESEDEYCAWKEVMVVSGSSMIVFSIIGVCCVLATKKYGWVCGGICFVMTGGGATMVYLGMDCGNVFTTSSSSAILAGYDTFTTLLTQQVADLFIAMPVIMGTFVFAVVFGFGYVFLMEKAVSCIVWTGIMIIIIAGTTIGILFFYSVSQATDKDSSMVVIEQICGGIVLLLTFIFVCMVIFLRDRIEIACEVVKSSSRAVVDLPMLFVFPICPISTAVLFISAWIYGQIYVFSNGEWVVADMPSSLNGTSNEYETFPSTYEYLDSLGDLGTSTFWLSVLLFFWTINILVFWSYMVVAGTVADWYFTVRDDKGEKRRGDKINELGDNPIWSSIKRTTRYHLGSVFVAAFIIAVIQTLRALVEYIQQVTDKAENPCTKCIFMCIRCFLWCLECCCRWIGKSALVWISIFGDCFCESAYAAFQLQWSNLARVAMMTVVSSIVISIGKFAILAIPTGLAALLLLMVEPYKSDLSSVVMPIIVICVMNYFVGWIFMVVYDTAVDTVFLCFLVDEQNNKETGLLADKGLREIVDKYKGKSEEIARQKKQISGNLNSTPAKSEKTEVEVV